MKIIDAINKINKEEKFRFRLLCDGDIYKYIGGSLYNETVGERAEWIIDNEWLNKEIEILEEEKKIPEKINWKPKESMAGQLTQKEQIEVIARRTEKLKKEFNNLLDYLKVLKK